MSSSYYTGQAATSGPDGASQPEGYDRQQQTRYQEHGPYTTDASHLGTQEHYAPDLNPQYNDGRQRQMATAAGGHEFGSNWQQNYNNPRDPRQWTGNFNPSDGSDGQFSGVTSGSQHAHSQWQSNRASDGNLEQQLGHRGWPNEEETFASDDSRPVMSSLVPDSQPGSSANTGGYSDPPYVDLNSYTAMGTDVLSTTADPRAIQAKLAQLEEANYLLRQEQARIEMERQKLDQDRRRQDELQRQLAAQLSQGLPAKLVRPAPAVVIDEEDRRKRRRVDINMTPEQAFEAFIHATSNGASITPDNAAQGCKTYSLLMEHLLRNASDLTSSQVVLETNHTWSEAITDIEPTDIEPTSTSTSTRAQSKARAPDIVDQIRNTMMHTHKEDALQALCWGNSITNLSFVAGTVPPCQWKMETPLRTRLEQEVLDLGARAEDVDDQEVSKDEYAQWAAYVTNPHGQHHGTHDLMQLPGLSALNTHWSILAFRHAPAAFLWKDRFSKQPWDLLNRGVVNVGYSMLRFCAHRMHDRQAAPPWSPVSCPFDDVEASITTIDTLYQENIPTFEQYDRIHTFPTRMYHVWAETAYSAILAPL